MDGRLEAYLDMRATRERLQRIEQRLLDEYVTDALTDTVPAGSHFLTHAVTFEGHPAFLRDDPPSRPVS